MNVVTAPSDVKQLDPAVGNVSGASSSNVIVNPVDTLGTPWSARESNVGDSVVEPLPFPAFMEPVVVMSSSDTCSLDQDRHLTPEGSDLASNVSEDTKTVVDEAHIRLKLSKQIDKLPEPYKSKMKALCQEKEKEQSEIKAKMERVTLSADGMRQPFLSIEDQKRWTKQSDDLVKATLEKCLHMLQQLKRNTNKVAPEKDPDVLRTWLHDHFDNPYPTSADKDKLAEQSGYTKKQVTNWFINARVRLWRPMILQSEKQIVHKTKKGGPKGKKVRAK